MKSRPRPGLGVRNRLDIHGLRPSVSSRPRASTGPTRGRPSAQRRTFSVTRGGQQRDRHLRRVGRVGRDDGVGQRPQRVAVGQRLGVGDVEPGAAERAVGQRGHQVVGHDVAAAGDVDEPGVVGARRSSGAVDDPVGLGRQGERQHHDVGAGERARRARRRRRRGRRRPPAGVVARTTVDVAAERRQQAEQRLGDAAAAEDRHPGARPGCGPGGRPHDAGPGVAVDRRSPASASVRACSATGSA